MSIQSIGAHWYNRRQTLKECTDKLLSFLIKLKDHNPPLFENYYKTGYSKKEAQSEIVELEYVHIKKTISKKAQDDDFPKISYIFQVWNGKDNDLEAASVSGSLGSSELESFTNNCVINLPYEGEQYLFYQVPANRHKLFHLLKNHWNPQWIQIDGERFPC